MPRPDFVTDEDIARWTTNMEGDPHMKPAYLASELIREVCYAGLWLCEQLEKENCPASIITRIQWTAGKLSFGKDIWEVHQEILRLYNNNGLTFEEDPNETKN